VGSIRLFLALCVVVWHIPEPPFRMLNAGVAVTCFFIISGFYMAMVINEKYARDDGEPWISTFYLARFWRLYPAYFASLMVMFFWCSLIDSPNPLTSRLPMPLAEQFLLLAINFGVIGQDFYQTMLMAADQHSGPSLIFHLHAWLGDSFFQNQPLVGQAWSLSCEFLFYLVAPFAVRTRGQVALALGCALIFRFLLIGVFGWRSGIWGYFFFPGALSMFLIGSVAYHVRGMLPWPEWHAAIGRSALVLFGAWFTWRIAAYRIVLPSNATSSLDGVTHWCFYLLFASAVPFMFEATRASKFDRRIGELSYPLYLIHGLVIGIVFIRWGAPRGVFADTLVAIGFALLCAWALNVLVEVPAEKYRAALLARGRSWSQSHLPQPAE
jgi:peptidoglycan/LPS O-acetylase OafA/YrhL